VSVGVTFCELIVGLVSVVQSSVETNLKKFIIRGVVYQPQGTDDPISDDHLPQLEHDVLLFKELGLNTLYICKLTYTD
jgi:hypothetical protein